jgi:outer membrane lipoprotein-sorting protein
MIGAVAPSLADALVLLHGADQRFGSVRALVREWRHPELFEQAWNRFAEQSGSCSIVVTLPGGDDDDEPDPPPDDERTRIWWLKPDSVRLEHLDDGAGPRVEVAVGTRWAHWDPEWGATSNDERPDVLSGTQGAPFPQLLDPATLLSDLVVEVVGEGTHRGRSVIVARGTPRPARGPLASPSLTPGADAHELLVDAHRGVVLRIASEIDGEVFAVSEIEEIAFDEAIEPQTFVLELPPGEEFAPLAAPSETVTLDEAARRAPFTVLAPSRSPRGAEVRVHLWDPRERPPVAAGVAIHYLVEPGGFSVSLTEGAAEDAEDRGLCDDGDVVERDGRRVRVCDLGGQRQLETEHLGTHVLALSHSMPTDLLVDMMLSLAPAPTEPPALA